MRITQRIVLLFLSALPLLAQADAMQLHRLFNDYYEAALREHPESATRLGRSEYDDRWTDWSATAVVRRHEQDLSFRKRLDQFTLFGLSEQDQVSARLLRYELDNAIEGDWLQTYLLRVSQMFGFHTTVYSTIDGMPSRTVKDYENIIARLRAVPAYIDQNVKLLDYAIQHHWTQPRITVDLMTQQLVTQSAQTAENTPLLSAFRRFPSNIPQSDQDRLRREATNAYTQQFLPAWRKLHDYMAQTYLPHARPHTALGSIPNGASAYAYQVRFSTTTDMTPQQIHELGEREVARIESEMTAIARETGFSGSLDEFERNLIASPEQHFQGKEDTLAYCRNVAKIVEPELPRLFNNVPKLLYGVRAIPEDREAVTASNAQAPSLDGTRPGWFNLNAYRPQKQTRYDKEALVLHEAVPGHIFQLSYAQQIAGQPAFRKIYHNSAYIEGWGLYAESLGSDVGVYRDPYSRFGRLASERFRAVRLVVDTGLHAFGWSRQQAIDYFQTHAPSNSLAEIDRYIAWPGQALSYKIGQLKITELRQRAEKELGPKFDIREFHEVVLRNGTLPLAILEEQVQSYIQKAKAAKAS